MKAAHCSIQDSAVKRVMVIVHVMFTDNNNADHVFCNTNMSMQIEVNKQFTH